MIKVLSYRFQQHYDPFTVLLANGSSKTRLLRHLSNHIFPVGNLQIKKSIRVIFFLENVQDLS